MCCEYLLISFVHKNYKIKIKKKKSKKKILVFDEQFDVTLFHTNTNLLSKQYLVTKNKALRFTDVTWLHYGILSQISEF